MEITNDLSAEELALKFSSGEMQTIHQSQDQQRNPSNIEELYSGLSASEIAEKQEELIKLKEGELTPEKLAEKKAEEDALKQAAPKKSSTPVKDIIDETVLSKFQEKFFKTDKLRPFSKREGDVETDIIPETWEDIIEILDANIEDKVAEAKGIQKEALINEVLQEKSSAIQWLFKNGNNFNSIEEMLPLINSVQQQDDFASLDAKNVDHQEYIIIKAMELRDYSDEEIADEITYLKENGKLEARAEKLKPSLDDYAFAQTQMMLEQKATQDANNEAYWSAHIDSLNKVLFEAKDIDGIKLKAEDKNLVASALYPDKNLGTLPIFTLIDKLVGQNNIGLLSKIVLLAADEAKFDAYYGSSKKENSSRDLQKVLRSSIKASAETVETNTTPTLKHSGYGNFLS